MIACNYFPKVFEKNSFNAYDHIGNSAFPVQKLEMYGKWMMYASGTLNQIDVYNTTADLVTPSFFASIPTPFVPENLEVSANGQFLATSSTNRLLLYQSHPITSQMELISDENLTESITGLVFNEYATSLIIGTATRIMIYNNCP